MLGGVPGGAARPIPARRIVWRGCAPRTRLEVVGSRVPGEAARPIPARRIVSGGAARPAPRLGWCLAGLRAPHPRVGATWPPRPPARDSCPWTLKGTGEHMAGGWCMPDQAERHVVGRQGMHHQVCKGHQHGVRGGLAGRGARQRGIARGPAAPLAQSRHRSIMQRERAQGPAAPSHKAAPISAACGVVSLSPEPCVSVVSTFEGVHPTMQQR